MCPKLSQTFTLWQWRLYNFISQLSSAITLHKASVYIIEFCVHVTFTNLLLFGWVYSAVFSRSLHQEIKSPSKMADNFRSAGCEKGVCWKSQNKKNWVYWHTKQTPIVNIVPIAPLNRLHYCGISHAGISRNFSNFDVQSEVGTEPWIAVTLDPDVFSRGLGSVCLIM